MGRGGYSNVTVSDAHLTENGSHGGYGGRGGYNASGAASHNSSPEHSKSNSREPSPAPHHREPSIGQLESHHGGYSGRGGYNAGGASGVGPYDSPPDHSRSNSREPSPAPHHREPSTSRLESHHGGYSGRGGYNAGGASGVGPYDSPPDHSRSNSREPSPAPHHKDPATGHFESHHGGYSGRGGYNASGASGVSPHNSPPQYSRSNSREPSPLPHHGEHTTAPAEEHHHHHVAEHSKSEPEGHHHHHAGESEEHHHHHDTEHSTSATEEHHAHYNSYEQPEIDRTARVAAVANQLAPQGRRMNATPEPTGRGGYNALPGAVSLDSTTTPEPSGRGGYNALPGQSTDGSTTDASA